MNVTITVSVRYRVRFYTRAGRSMARVVAWVSAIRRPVLRVELLVTPAVARRLAALAG